jgi:hypothetical protein
MIENGKVALPALRSPEVQVISSDGERQLPGSHARLFASAGNGGFPPNIPFQGSKANVSKGSLTGRLWPNFGEPKIEWPHFVLRCSEIS